MRIFALLFCLHLFYLPIKAKQLSGLPEGTTLHKLTLSNGSFWAVDYGGGHIFASNDLGVSWQQKAHLGAEFFEDIQFTDSLTGYVCGDYGYVYKTTDGGNHWTEISPLVPGRIKEHYRNIPGKNQQPKGVFVAYYDMHFKDAQNGYISGFSTEPSAEKPSFSPIAFTTTDGGKTWNQISRQLLNTEDYRAGSPAYMNGMFYLNDRQIWKTRKVNNNWVVQHSENGGNTWENALLPGFKPDDRWVLRKVLFQNANDGFVIGGTLDEDSPKALVFRTRDGGNTWSLLPNQWPHLHDALLVSNTLFVTGKNGLIDSISLNSGPRWTSLQHLPENYSIDGSVSIHEIRDTTYMREVSRSPLYVVKKSTDFTYIGIRSNNFTILNAYLVNNDSLKILHASAALGQADYKRSGQQLTTPTKNFEWIYRDPASWDEKHPNGVDTIEEFYERFGWMANTWTMGSYREFEMVISNQHFDKNTQLVVSFGSLKEDAYGIRFYLNGEEISLTGTPANDKSLHDGYLINPISLNPALHEK